MSKYQIQKQRSRERAQQNALLRQHGYSWRKGFRNYYDADHEIETWTLYDANGNAVSLAEALTVCEQVEAKAAVALANISKPCQKNDHCFCLSESCQCECHKPAQEQKAEPPTEESTADAEQQVEYDEIARQARFIEEEAVGIEHNSRQEQESRRLRGIAHAGEMAFQVRSERELKSAMIAGANAADLASAREKSGRGGARPGAGRKPDPSRFDERSYQAGYKAGLRKRYEVEVDEKPRMRTNADVVLQSCEYGDLRHQAHYQVRVVGGTERGVFCCDAHLEECKQQLEKRGW